jgi:APA family basic amino acid/polyamine antiporter
MHLPGIARPEMVIARAKTGIQIDVVDVMGDELQQETYAIFLLVSPEGTPGLHLRMLAELANRIEQEDFLDRWHEARDSAQLKRFLIDDGHYMSMSLSQDNGTRDFIDNAIKDLSLPEGSLVAMIRRGSQRIVPSGSTVLLESDQLIVIGEPQVLVELRKMIS